LALSKVQEWKEGYGVLRTWKLGVDREKERGRGRKTENIRGLAMKGGSRGGWINGGMSIDRESGWKLYRSRFL
jgi:hypothetical protein